jgi:Tfp pilus assembly protein PilZ
MTDNNNNQDENKRRHPRKRHIGVVDYSVMLSPQGTGIIKNISEGGLCVIVEKYMPEGTLLKLRFQLPDSPRSSSIETAGKVIWIEKAEGGYATGIQFMI